MKSYKGSFKKKDGSVREMNFAKLKDLPPEFLAGKLKGSKPAKLTEGSEVVWDLDAKDFRVFNWNSVLGDVKESDINFVL